jgi:hypothetical protein
MLLRRVGGSRDLLLVLDHELLLLVVEAGRAREASGGGARGAKRLSAGVPAVSRQGGGRPGAARPRP